MVRCQSPLESWNFHGVRIERYPARRPLVFPQGTFDGSGDVKQYRFLDAASGKAVTRPASRSLLATAFRQGVRDGGPMERRPPLTQFRCVATADRHRTPRAGLLLGFRLWFPSGSGYPRGAISLRTDPEARAIAASGGFLDEESGYARRLPVHLIRHVARVDLYSRGSLRVGRLRAAAGDARGLQIRLFDVPQAIVAKSLSDTLWHEVGHVYESAMGRKGQSWLRNLLLLAAALDPDPLPFPYHRANVSEHWAEAVAEYMTVGRAACFDFWPHRAALIDAVARGAFASLEE